MITATHKIKGTETLVMVIPVLTPVMGVGGNGVEMMRKKLGISPRHERVLIPFTDKELSQRKDSNKGHVQIVRKDRLERLEMLTAV